MAFYVNITLQQVNVLRNEGFVIYTEHQSADISNTAETGWNFLNIDNTRLTLVETDHGSFTDEQKQPGNSISFELFS